MRALLVDDSPLIRARLRALLALAGQEQGIFEAGDVPSAIRQIEEIRPNLVVLDLRLPGGSGFDVLGYLRNTASSPLVIVLTNYATQVNRKRCPEDGAHHFFDKTKEYAKAIEVIKARLASTTCAPGAAGG
jgi:two-component system OmpR family response regulator